MDNWWVTPVLQVQCPTTSRSVSGSTHLNQTVELPLCFSQVCWSKDSKVAGHLTLKTGQVLVWVYMYNFNCSSDVRSSGPKGKLEQFLWRDSRLSLSWTGDVIPCWDSLLSLESDFHSTCKKNNIYNLVRIRPHLPFYSLDKSHMARLVSKIQQSWRTAVRFFIILKTRMTVLLRLTCGEEKHLRLSASHESDNLNSLQHFKGISSTPKDKFLLLPQFFPR